MKGQKQLHSKSADTPDGDLWYTPNELIEWIETDWIADYFTLDAAACAESAICNDFITQEQNALLTNWQGRAGSGWIFCNPPYSLVKEFTAKAIQEARQGAKIVLLVPARTDTNWFYSVAEDCHELKFIKGRICFWNPTKQNATSAPFPSVLVKFNDDQDLKKCNFEALSAANRGLTQNQRTKRSSSCNLL